MNQLTTFAHAGHAHTESTTAASVTPILIAASVAFVVMVTIVTAVVHRRSTVKQRIDK